MTPGKDGRTVLVIDDDESVRALIRRVLEGANYPVVEVQDARRWREACGPAGPSLAVVDLFMPDRDGFETIAELQRELPSVPIVAVSGSVPIATASALAAASHMGADRVLPKPFTPQQLLDVVRSLLPRAP